MLNTIYRLTEPRKIEIEFNDIRMDDDQVIVLSLIHISEPTRH